MSEFSIDLSSYKYRTQVTEDEYREFISWYKQYANIRVLKVKDMVSTRTVKDKKTKESVCQEITKGMNTGYLIFDDFYKKWKNIEE